MKVPIEWLKELVSFRAGPDQLAEMLTMAGLETMVLPEEILEVDVLPNRGDCLSVRGIAREVSALTKVALKKSKIKVKEGSEKVGDFLKVEVRDHKLCPRYMARVIKKVKVKESPQWLKKKLERAGYRSINNVVDVTNYLLHEIGQPMHAFDASLIKDQKIIVRRANPEEKVITLDGKEHVLSSENLVIADPEKVIALAGVMGGANSEVGVTTETVILESAFFDPVSIHKTSKQLKIRTESSIRFEYGVDWLAVEEALDRGAALIAELSGGEVLKGKIDSRLHDWKPVIIELRFERLSEILGLEIPKVEIINILKRLGFGIKQIMSKGLKVVVSSFRAKDVEREIDLIEEIARIYGFGRVPSTLPHTSYPGKMVFEEDRARAKVREVLLGCGLIEVQTNSMLSPKDFEGTGIPLDKAVKIANPLTIEESVLRTHLLPGLLKVLKHNQNRQEENVFIFEIGKVFALSADPLPEEKWKVAGVLAGSPFISALDKGQVDYFYLKGVIENLFLGLGLDFPRIKETDHFLLQWGKSAEIEGVGIFGALHPDLKRSYEITKPVFFFEFDLEALFKLRASEKRYKPLPKYPFVFRDISMFIPQGLENQVIIDLIKEVGKDLVERVYPFDRYQDSIAYRIIYRHRERTLTEEEVNKKHQEIVQALTSKLMVKIR